MIEREGWIVLCSLTFRLEIRARRCPACAFFLFRDEDRFPESTPEVEAALERTWSLVLVLHARRAHADLFSRPH